MTAVSQDQGGERQGEACGDAGQHTPPSNVVATLSPADRQKEPVEALGGGVFRCPREAGLPDF